MTTRTTARPHRRRAPSPLAPVSLAELRAGPAAVDVVTAAAAMGVGRATLYDALRRGERPVQVITVGTRMKVLTASLIALLDPADARAGAA